MTLTDNLKTYISGVIVVLLLLILIPTAIHNFTLQHQVKTLETDKTTLQAEALIKRMEVTGLQNAIGEQNRQINELEVQTKQMMAERAKAQQEAAARVLMLNNRIAWLEKDKGASCNAAGIGTTILNEVLP